MGWNDLRKRFLGRPIAHREARPSVTRRRAVRLTLEQLEDRSLPSSYTAASVSDLIADIKAANLSGGSNTITLVAGTTFALSAVNDTTDGATGLPRIAANDNLTILGNGDLIQRSTATGTPAFRLFDVASGASLSLSNLTLQGGLAFGSGLAAEGGAIYNQGTLTLNSVTVQGNVAQGADGGLSWAGQSAEGGGIYSAGALTLGGNTIIQNNQAIGGRGRDGTYPTRGSSSAGGPGGNALGGGLYVSSGTATLNGVTLSSNTAQGGAGGNGFDATSSGGGHNHGGVASAGGFGSYLSGPGGNGGNGFGGGLYAAAGTVSMLNDTVTSNTAQGGAAGKGGSGAPDGNSGRGEGGGLYIDVAALAALDAFTQVNLKHNHASTSYADIDGSYTTYP
jgi:hypothetical protein